MKNETPQICIICRYRNNYDQLIDACRFALEPTAPFSTDRLEMANRIIKAIADKAKAAIIEAEKG